MWWEWVGVVEIGWIGIGVVVIGVEGWVGDKVGWVVLCMVVG